MNLRSALAAGALFLWGCPEAPPPPKPAAYRIPVPNGTFPMNAEETAALKKQEAVVLQLLRSRYGKDTTLNHSKADLAVLQRLIDDKALRPDQTAELQCLGIALGQVFAAETPLRWVTMQDEHGRDPALEYPGMTVMIFPMTMISKRIEDGREVNLADLFAGVMESVKEMKDRADYKK